MEILIYLGILLGVSFLFLFVLYLFKYNKIKKEDLAGATFLFQLAFYLFKSLDIKDSDIKDNIEKVVGYVLDMLTEAIELKPDIEILKLKEYVYLNVEEILTNEGILISTEFRDTLSKIIDYILANYYKN